MRDRRLSATGEGLPRDLRPAFEAYAERGEWAAAIALLLAEGARRPALNERLACYHGAASLYEEQFANSVEAQGILEYVLGLSPDDPAAISRLRDLYTRARRKDKLRWLAQDREKLAALAPVPTAPQSQLAAQGASIGEASLPARIGAAIGFIVLPASVIAANMRAVALAERHDNGGGVLGGLIYAGLDLAFCAVFVALTWFPVRWALRRVGKSALLAMFALLAATFLIAMVPTLGWNAIDAANVLLDPHARSPVSVRVVDHARRSKGGGFFSVVRETSRGSGSTQLTWSLGLEPIGSEHVLLRGEGFFGRTYYLRPQQTAR